ncbi:SDR family NAD(P)-dependent oxidoreductase [Jejubacter sp. L23]|uniref:SDR family NAD(P)-dependent oxidoreductase n=1 Tax=Jejubacter sp. L23 TaxID=3092086 RepID=UPI003D752DB8
MRETAKPLNFAHMLSNQKKDPIARKTETAVISPSTEWDASLVKNDFTDFILYLFTIDRVAFNEDKVRFKLFFYQKIYHIQIFTLPPHIRHWNVGLTRAVAKEYAGPGIRVNAVRPGATETPNYMRSTGGDAHLLDDMIPMRRIGQPEDVAETVLWLLSEKASYVTGSTFSVDGGMSI